VQCTYTYIDKLHVNFLKHLLLYANGCELANKFTGDLQKYIAAFLNFECLSQLHHPARVRLYMIVPIAHTSTGKVVVSIQMITLFK